MTLNRLLNHFSIQDNMPVELNEVRDFIVSDLCVQDRIVFCKEDMDQNKLRGLYYQYTQRNGVYADPELHSVVIYCSKLSIDWQRLICCKELVHIFDKQVEKTILKDDISGLAEKMLGPLSTESFGKIDIMATKDRFAMYIALGILFPEAAINRAKKAIAAKLETVDTIAEKVALPKEFVLLAMKDDFKPLLDTLVT